MKDKNFAATRLTGGRDYIALEDGIHPLTVNDKRYREIGGLSNENVIMPVVPESAEPLVDNIRKKSVRIQDQV